MADRQRREVLVKVVGDNLGELKRISSSLGLLNRDVSGLSSSFATLKNAALGYLGAISARELVGFSDEIQGLNDRIAVLSGGQEVARGVLGDLNEAANRTKTSLEGIATVYSRLAASTRKYTKDTKILVDTTELLQNTFRLSGATPAEASAVAIQLSQGLAAGAVRGAELRSVLEQNVFLATLLRERFGDNIFKLAEKDVIKGADIFKILFKNQELINEQTKQLSQTFGQTLTVAFNDLKLAVFDINKKFGLSEKFASLVETLTKKIGLLAIAFTGLAAALIATNAALVGGSLLKVIGSLAALLNPVTLAVAALGVAFVTFFDDVDDFVYSLDLAGEAVRKFFGITKIQRQSQDLSLFSEEGKKIQEREQLLRDMDKQRRKQDRLGVTYGPSKEEFEEQKKRADFLSGLSKNAIADAVSTKDALEALNKSYIAGQITASDYYKALERIGDLRVTEEFSSGKKTLIEYNLALLEIQKRDIAKDFDRGAISVETFNQKIGQNQLDVLNAKLQANVITLKEFDAELLKIQGRFSPEGALRVGATEYVESIGTTSRQVADSVKKAFDSFSDAIFEATKSGKADFKDFTQSVLDDITRIIIRTQIVAPIAAGISSFFTPAAAASPAGGGSQFGSFPINQYASGGIVDSPSFFSYGKSSSMSMGVAGEAGPEAILPLSRGPGGSLGVQATQSPVNIQIINNNSSEVSTRETVGPNGDRAIEVLIESKVRDGIARGSFDKAFQTSYGVSRKGR